MNKIKILLQKNYSRGEYCLDGEELEDERVVLTLSERSNKDMNQEVGSRKSKEEIEVRNNKKKELT